MERKREEGGMGGSKTPYDVYTERKKQRENEIQRVGERQRCIEGEI